MDDLTLALWSLPVLLLLIFLRVPIGLAMLSVGLVGSALIFGDMMPLLQQIKTLAYGQFSIHSLTIIPLTPTSDTASRTSSSLKGLIVAIISFTRLPFVLPNAILTLPSNCCRAA